jgi:hypothetical protein
MGAAAVPALVPFSQDLINTAWETHPSHPLLVSTLALGVAQGQVDAGWAKGEARKTGYDGDNFDALVSIANTGPGIAEAFNLWRRGEIDEAGFRRAVKRQGLEPEWADALVKTKIDRLTPAQIALAIVRSLMADPNFLPVDLPVTGGKVPAYPQSNIDPVKEAEAHGIDRERLRIMVGEIGLPMSLQAAASAVFRNIIERPDFNRAVVEGDTRPEWADAILEQARQIPTARDFFENALRGYHDFDWAVQQAKRHGMSEADATVIYQNQGRPMNIRQITQALSRGADFNPEPGEIKDPYQASVVEGNLKPAYYELAKALKYTLPSPFVMRQLTASGVWSEAKAAKRLKDAGWIPQDADEAAAAWAQGTGSTTDTHIAKAQTQLWSTLHRTYLAGDADEATVREKLTQLDVPTSAHNAIVGLWNHERELIRQRLTPAQVKKAWQKAVVNELTGAPWTRDDALAELLSRGWSHADANTFLGT